MVKRFFTLLCLILAWNLLCCSAFCQEQNDPVAPLWRAQDPALEKKVSVNGNRMVVGELLQSLSRSTGTTLFIDRNDPCFHVPLFVSIKEMPLADAMNALWSLLSFHKAPWRWQRSGSKGRYAYFFSPTPEARRLTALLKSRIQELFEAHVAQMMNMAQMTPTERKKHIKDLTKSFLVTDDNVATYWTNDNLHWDGLRTFAESASPEEQAQVLRGEKKIIVPISRLSASGRAFVNSVGERIHSSTVNPDGTLTPIPPASEIVIEAGADIGIESVSPSLYIKVNGTMMSYAGGGALESGVQNWIGTQWLLPGDSVDTPAESLTLKRPSDAPEEPDAKPGAPREGDDAPVTRRIGQLAFAAPFSVMVLLPDEQKQDPGTPYHLTLEAYLKQAHQWTGMVKKWRGNVLLCSHPIRFLKQEISLP